MNRLRQFFGKINIGVQPLYDEPMAAHTTLRIGGPADAFVAPVGSKDIGTIVAAARREEIPLFVLGGGSNILVGDKGIRGIVLSTQAVGSSRGLVAHPIPAGAVQKSSPSVAQRGRSRYLAGAGMSIDDLALESLARGLSGFEHFHGLPGSLGGALYMNARCFDHEMAGFEPEVLSLDPEGNLVQCGFDPAEWSYKRSPFQPGHRYAGHLILSASLMLTPEESWKIARCMRENHAFREQKGHYRLPSAGSVFKNDRSFGRPSGVILDGLGLRGARIGDALVAPWHANIFVNAGGASAADMAALIHLAMQKVHQEYGRTLEPEILFVGEF